MAYIKTFDEFIGEPVNEGLFGNRSLFDIYYLSFFDMKSYADSEDKDPTDLKMKDYDKVMEGFHKKGEKKNSIITLEDFYEMWDNRMNSDGMRGKFFYFKPGKKYSSSKEYRVYIISKDNEHFDKAIKENKGKVEKVSDKTFAGFAQREEDKMKNEGNSDEDSKRVFKMYEFMSAFNKFNCLHEGAEIKPGDFYIRICEKQ